MVGLTLFAGLTLSVPALATNIPVVHYDPPKIRFQDQSGTPSIEDVTISKDGQEYVFTTPSGSGQAPGSEPGCTDSVNTMYRCPVPGIQKIVANLGELDDTASIDLGSKAAKVKQILRGQAGEDEITGGTGPQRIKGGSDDDTLIGGPGPDRINGGGGNDICEGGPGNDTIKNCEPLVPG